MGPIFSLVEKSKTREKEKLRRVGLEAERWLQFK